MEHYQNRNDLHPNDLKLFRLVEKAFLRLCRQFGYQEIKTATIEPLHIFTATDSLTPDLLKQVYSFLDWGGYSGERVVLRPDCTTATARYYLAHRQQFTKQAKLCYVENHFFVAQTGQDVTERWQLGVENIGDDSALADVETIFIALDTLKASGFETLYLNLSYPSIVAEALNLTVKDEGERSKAMDMIKHNQWQDIKSLEQGKIDYHPLYKLLHFRGTNAAYLANLQTDFQESETVQRYLERFKTACELLDKLGVSYVVNFSLSKNFNYYSGIQFEILSAPQKRSAKETLCSGGRYDNLISALGDRTEVVPSVGFALYFKNMLPYISAIDESSQRVGVMIQNVTCQNVKTAQNLSQKLGAVGFYSQIFLKKIEQDDYCNFCLILEVDGERFKEGYQLIHSQKIDKPLLKSLVSEASHYE
jgi:histidyl-tRNA synthetase